MIRSTTLWELFETSYKRQRLRGGSKENPRQYRIQLNHFGRFLGHEPTLDDLTDELLADFMEWLSEGRAVPTVNKAFSCIAALWRHAADLGLVSNRPTVRPLPEPENIPMAWMVDDLRRLLNACRETPGEIEGVPASDWLTAIHWFWWSTGERRSAAMSIELSWVDLNRGEVAVPGSVRKGRRKAMLY
jgi:site-specific recombinase XerD